MNAAFIEIDKIFKFDCLIFHDVDMFVEDGRHMYNCVDAPRHLGALVQKYNYTFPCQCHVGGVLSIKKEQFKAINGFHILFYGWGDEDKDMLGRLRANKLNITRYPQPLAKYTMITHERDKWNPPNRFRESFLLLHKSLNDIKKYGLNTVNYSIDSFTLKPTYTLLQLKLSKLNCY
ncbi:DgyrCDS3151 [Dimorphilus gyrociliatus]|uniref:DgyrCDS3151 n=1 Tax=Dimorphilus gyrociliatus TaxID=2664684 RepID=A0A7I8VDG9_9ANNE|nr:DgyrCDS3151 [Dimorphilus gyrociliatus]